MHDLVNRSLTLVLTCLNYRRQLFDLKEQLRKLEIETEIQIRSG